MRSTAPAMPTPITQVLFGDTAIAVGVAADDASREQGLSGRADLADGTGLLFVFDKLGLWGFWMKDMNFAIDIIYMDQYGKVVTVVSDATPESYREDPPRVFYPTLPALYVLEVPAGFSGAHQITEGSIATFK
jgi:uncharacterized membrane protein (UPF0127 family)